MNEIESMIKKSNAFLWVEVGLDLLVSILFFNGWFVRASIGDVQVPEEEWNMLNTMMIVFGVIFIIVLMVGVIIRLVNQDTRRVLAGVITILFVGGIFGIISGIYLFVINGRENAIKYRHRETNLTNNRGDM
jgi:intracellular septation protein A